MSLGASLGVLIPTRNSAALLPDHLAAMEPWLDIAKEVVVVDSYSSDGTVELLRARLTHPNTRFLSHPPGLYASWNAGLQQLTSDYTCIATIGDTISRDGIGRLISAARALEGDVVMSKPTFKKPSGEIVSMEWPIDDIFRSLAVSAPRRLNRMESITFAAVHPTQALTGSCASNVFRTAVLKRFPFPTEFGTAGDGFWSLRQAGRAAWVVVPGHFSTFLLHPTSASQSENRPHQNAARADAFLFEAAAEWVREGLITDLDLTRLGWNELKAALTGYLDAKGEFDRLRKSHYPWLVNPWAWRARRERRLQFARLRVWKEQALRAATPDEAGAAGLAATHLTARAPGPCRAR